MQLIENKNKLLLSLNLSHALMIDKLIFQSAFNSNYVILRYNCFNKVSDDLGYNRVEKILEFTKSRYKN